MKYIVKRLLSIIVVFVLVLCITNTYPFSTHGSSYVLAESNVEADTQNDALPFETEDIQTRSPSTDSSAEVVVVENPPSTELEVIETELPPAIPDEFSTVRSEEKTESMFLRWITVAIDFISDLSIEHITLLSVLVTLVIFVSGKQSEAKYKKLEARREEYTKFINLLQKSFSGKLKQDDATKKEFFDTGVSLLLYGSKKVYKKYLFFREFTSNPLIVQSRYNAPEISIYIIADLLKTIRHEVGMTSFSELSTNEALAFFVNDIGLNPVSKIQSYRARYRIFMIKAELVAIDCTKLVFVKKVYYCVIKPIFGIIRLLLKYILLVPLGRVLVKLFPKWAAQVIKEKNEPQP